MRILCTFPGKYGDLLWALPTIRAISRRIEAPVSLLIPSAFRSIAPLLRGQPYLRAVIHDEDWLVENTAPISPRLPPASSCLGYDQVFHLGYRDWPLPDVCRHTMETASLALVCDFPGSPHEPDCTDIREDELCLSEPWIDAAVIKGGASKGAAFDVAVGFTDEHFELKYGLVELLRRSIGGPVMSVGNNYRWSHEANRPQCSWEVSAVTLYYSRAFLGCCSALHVLAVAIGTPVVLMEPNPHRHNDTFYPLGKTGPQVTLVTGSDGLPTFDARHVADRLAAVLASTTSFSKG